MNHQSSENGRVNYKIQTVCFFLLALAFLTAKCFANLHATSAPSNQFNAWAHSPSVANHNNDATGLNETDYDRLGLTTAMPTTSSIHVFIGVRVTRQACLSNRSTHTYEDIHHSGTAGKSTQKFIYGLPLYRGYFSPENVGPAVDVVKQSTRKL